MDGEMAFGLFILMEDPAFMTAADLFVVVVVEEDPDRTSPWQFVSRLLNVMFRILELRLS